MKELGVLGFWVSGFGFRVSGIGYRVSGIGYRVPTPDSRLPMYSENNVNHVNAANIYSQSDDRQNLTTN
jgi:hypothetical protein